MRRLPALFAFLVLLAGSLPLHAQRFAWARALEEKQQPAWAFFQDDGVSATDAAGNTYVAGSFADSLRLGSTTLRGTAGNFANLYLAKFDSTGAVLWVRQGQAANSGQFSGQGPSAITLNARGEVYLVIGTSANWSFAGLSRPTEGTFIMKLSANGTARWAWPLRPYGQPVGGADVRRIAVAADGSVHVIGWSTLLDSLNGVPTVHSTMHGTVDNYVAKFDTVGHALWVHTLLPAHGDSPLRDLAVDGAGNVYITGSSWMDITLSTGQTHSSGSQRDQFVISYAPNGQSRWAWWGNGGGAIGIDADAAGNVYVAGGGGGQVGSTSFWGPYLMRFSSTGQPVWLRAGLSTSNGFGTDVTILANGDVALVGTYSGSQGPVSADLYQLPQLDSLNVVALVYSPQGVLLKVAAGGGYGDDVPTSVTHDAAGNLYVYGQTESRVGFGGYGLATGPIGRRAHTRFLTRIKWDACQLQGALYLDINASGSRDAGEIPFPRPLVLASQPLPLVASNDPVTGLYSFALELGAYTLPPPTPPLHYQVQQGAAGYAGTFQRYGEVHAGGDFGIAPRPNEPDLRVTITAAGNSRPGFANRYHITLANVGTTTVGPGPLTLSLDPILTYTGSNPAATPQGGSVYTWTYAPLAPFGQLDFDLDFTVDTTVVIGTLLTSTANAPLASDLVPADNTATLVQTVTDSFDPNSIEVSHGTLTPAQVSAGQPLDYTIHFQNLGTATAFRVVIHDTLNLAALQAADFELIASSHPCQWSLAGPGVLVVRFPGIQLPHVGANRLGSMGFVRFRVTGRHTLAVGDVIRQRAHIGFDFNQLVTTNTALTTVVNPTGLMEKPAIAWQLHPNPATTVVQLAATLTGTGTLDIRLLDLTGRTLRQQQTRVTAGAWEGTLDVADVAPGVYLVRIQQPDGSLSTHRLVRR